MKQKKKTSKTFLKGGFLSVFATLSLVSPATAETQSSNFFAVTTSPAAVIDEANRIMGLPFEQFVREPQNPPFDWSTNGCSGPGPAEWNAAFEMPCRQHDFGYRNYGAQGALKLSVTRETKDWIDHRFGTELFRLCQGHPFPGDCNTMAAVYAEAVQQGGDSSFF